jgi:hypothetical protein
LAGKTAVVPAVLAKKQQKKPSKGKKQPPIADAPVWCCVKESDPCSKATVSTCSGITGFVLINRATKDQPPYSDAEAQKKCNKDCANFSNPVYH